MPPSGSGRAGLIHVVADAASEIGKLVLRKVDQLSCVRFGSARYSVPTELIGKRSSCMC